MQSVLAVADFVSTNALSLYKHIHLNAMNFQMFWIRSSMRSIFLKGIPSVWACCVKVSSTATGRLVCQVSYHFDIELYTSG